MYRTAPSPTRLKRRRRHLADLQRLKRPNEKQLTEIAALQKAIEKAEA